MRLPLLFLFFTLLILIQAQNKIDAWDYVFNGTCQKNLSSICLPHANLTFAYIWDNYTENQIISEANEFIKSQPMFEKNLYIDRSRSWFDQSLGVFLNEKTNANETLGSFLLNQTYSSEFDLGMFSHTPYYERDLELFKKLNLTESDSSVSIIRLAITLLYHFYHFEDSPYKADLRLFPKKPVGPLALLTNYEISLLRNDEAEKFVWELRKFYLECYYFLGQKVQASLSEQDFIDLFNRTEIKTDEWTYAFSMIYAFSTFSERNINGQKKEIAFISPIFRLVVQNKEEEETKGETSKHMNWIENQTETNLVFEFKSRSKLLKNDELSMVSNNEMHHVWLNMGFLVKKDNCITVNLVPKEVEETFHLPSVYCVKAKDENLLTKLYLTGNLLNMNEAQMKKCKKLIEKEGKITEERKMEVLFNECQHPKWSKANLFKGLITELDLRIATYENNYKEAEKTALRRTRDGESTQLPLEIRDYLNERLKTCREIMSYVKELKKINRKMNHITDVDRKKLKEAKEEQLEKEEEAKIERELREEL